MKEIVCDAKHDHRRKGIERECHESARKGNIFGVKKQKQIFGSTLRFLHLDDYTQYIQHKKISDR